MESQTEAREPKQSNAGPEGGAERMSAERAYDWPVLDLVRELVKESQALIRGEAQLLRAEMSEKVAQAERGVVSMVGGTAALFAGIVLLLSAVALALNLAMAGWVAFLIVGAVATAAGGAMVAAGKKRVEPKSLKPERSIEEVKADGRFVKERLGS